MASLLELKCLGNSQAVLRQPGISSKEKVRFHSFFMPLTLSFGHDD